RDQATVVVPTGHGGERHDADDDLDGADNPGGGGEDRADDDRGHGQTARHTTDPHAGSVEQAVRNAGALEDGSHENEQRNGGKQVVGGNLLDDPESLDAHLGTEYQQAEAEGGGYQAEGDRQADEHQHEKHGKHQGSQSGIHAGGPIGRKWGRQGGRGDATVLPSAPGPAARGTPGRGQWWHRTAT